MSEYVVHPVLLSLIEEFLLDPRVVLDKERVLCESLTKYFPRDVGYHGHRLRRVYFRVLLRFVDMLESVNKLELILHLCHLTDRQQGSRVLIKVVSPNRQLRWFATSTILW